MLKGRNGAVFCFFFFLLSKKLPVFSKKKRFDDDPLRERRVLTNSPQKRKVFMPKIKLYFRALRFSFSVQWKANGLALVLYGSLLLIATTATLVTTRLFQMVLDAIAAKTQLPALLPLAVLLALSLVLQRAARGFSSRLNDRARQKAIEEYEHILIRHTSSLPAAFIDSKAGRILSEELRHYDYNITELSVSLLFQFSEFYAFFAAFVILARYHLPFALLFLALTVPSSLVSAIYADKTDRFRWENSPDRQKASYYRWILTDPTPAMDVRMYNLTDAMTDRYTSQQGAYLTRIKKLRAKHTLFTVLTSCISGAGTLVFLLFTISEAVAGRLGVGSIALYTGYAATAMDSFQNLSFSFGWSWVYGTRKAARLFEFFSLEPEAPEPPARKLEAFSSLAFDHVRFTYPHTEKEILHDLSFTLNKGERLFLAGINGSGKTTVVKLLLRLYEPTGGRILLNGHPITEYDVAEVRKLFSVLFQSFVRYPLTLRDNVGLSDLARMDRDEEIEDALNESGVYDDLREKLPDGLDSMMTRRFSDTGVALSKGQWQKIAIARAYFKRAEIILFDEPSSALDAESEDRIFRSFSEMAEEKTGIMISHRISGARLASRILLLEDGRIAEEGTHEELLEKNGLYARFFALQRDKYLTKEGV